ncbi:MAG: branched-chain amino acid ABC transporter ATP-binding protein/permease [Hyphomicrobiales bacterium]|nr:branched-chain amino acid ABC transporter ATP-binding protein/permease [Hyphomicrobiales bacterium]
MEKKRAALYRSLLIIFALVALCLLLSFATNNNYYRLMLAVIPIWAVLGISWNVFSGYSGLISFGHAAFFGVGAYTVTLGLVNFGLTPWIGVPLGAIVGALTAGLIGIPTFRLRGVYFALAMLAYPLSMVYVFDWLGLQEITLPMMRENGPAYMQFTDNRWYQVVSLSLFIVAILTCLFIERSRFGRSLLAIKQNELAAEACGVDTFKWKLYAILISGAMAGAAGGLFAVIQLVVTPASVFGLVISAQAMILTLFGGAGIIWGPVIGAAVLLPLSETLHAELGHLVPGITGMVYGAAIILVMVLAPEGIYWRINDLLKRRKVSETGDAPAPVAVSSRAPAMHETRRARSGEVLLGVDNISKFYGGLGAVKEVGFEIHTGEIVGVIGPNGAGKTTLFNILNGLIQPSSGRVVFNGIDITSLKPNRRCAAGIGRTFQVVRSFPRMTVEENVLIGAYVRAENEGDAWRRAAEALGTVGLTGRAHALAGSISTKELRLMELARALAGDPRLLLLDEPLAGLGADEASELTDILKRLASGGLTIAIIEHTMQAMVDLADRMIVLDHGVLLTEGAPEQVTRDPHVIEAYLGRKWAAKHA